MAEGGLVDQVAADRQVLPLAMQVDKLEVDQLDSLLMDLTEDVLGCLGHYEQEGWVPTGCGVAGPYGSAGR